MEGRNLELIDDDLSRVLSLKSPEEKLRIAFSMWQLAHDLICAHIESLHPDWNEKMKAREAARRLSCGSF